MLTCTLTLVNRKLFQLNYVHSYVLSQPTVDILVTITPGGDNTAGDDYSLTCSTMISAGLTGQPTITWLDPMNNMITSGVETTGSMSTLTFNPLAVSHAGTYTCTATLGSTVETAEVMVTVESERLVSAFFVPSHLNL